MNYTTIRIGVIVILLQIFSGNIYAQSLKSVELKWDNGISINSFNRDQTTGYPLPLVTFHLNDVYKTGTTDYFILKGGSYFTTLSSWWYVKGGALPLINRQQQYRVSPGYERAATIGFRCVKDVN